MFVVIAACWYILTVMNKQEKQRPATFPMKHRKLRIAWSVASGIACVLLIVLRVCSNWSGFSTNRFNNSSVMTSVSANSSKVFFLQMDFKSRRVPGLAYPPHGWVFNSIH
jgi:hypothetical protein